MTCLTRNILENLQSFLQDLRILKLYRVIKDMCLCSWSNCEAVFASTLFVYRRCKHCEANFCELWVTCILLMLTCRRQNVLEGVASKSCHTLVLMSIRCHSILLSLKEESLQLVVKSSVDLNGGIRIKNWSWRSSSDVLPWPMKRHLPCQVV